MRFVPNPQFLIHIAAFTITCLVVLSSFGGSPVLASDSCITGEKPTSSYTATSFFVESAEAAKPQSVSVQASGPIFIHLSRTTRTETGRARLVITRTSPNNPMVLAICETGWIDLSHLNDTFSTPQDIRDDGVWFIQVFADITGGQDPQLPYSLHVELSTPAVGTSKVKFLGYVPPARSFGDNVANRDFGTCSLSPTPSKDDSGIETATSDSFVEHGSALPHIYFVLASRNIYVQLHSKNDPVLKVRLSAKEPGYFPFAPICEINKRASELSRGILVSGQATWDRLLNPLWRVEIVASSDDGQEEKASRNEIDVRILRNHDPKRSYDSHSIYDHFPDTLPSSYVCRNSRRKAAPPRAPVALNDNAPKPESPTAVFITLPTTFSPEQVGLVEHAAETAIAIWSAECSSCSIDTLSVLKIGDRFLVRTELFQALQMWPSSPLFPLFVDKRISSFRVLIGNVPLFTEVSPTDSAILKLCQASPSTVPEPLHRVALAYRCNPTPNRNKDTVMQLILGVTDGPTACGRSANIIACEPDRELLELNGRDYRFSVDGSKVQLGGGPIDVNLFQVVLHEVGHWLGLGHVLTDESIMSKTLERSRCINDGDLAELTAALTKPTRYSPIKPQAFFAHEP